MIRLAILGTEEVAKEVLFELMRKFKKIVNGHFHISPELQILRKVMKNRIFKSCYFMKNLIFQELHRLLFYLNQDGLCYILSLT